MSTQLFLSFHLLGILCEVKKSVNLSFQAIANEMDAQNERLGWLNKHAPQILASPNVSPQSRDQHVAKLRTINLKWSKVKLDK